MAGPWTVAQVSEEELLRPVLEIFSAHNERAEAARSGRLLLGPGDDCAVYDLTPGRTVVTVDTQTQGQDYLMTYPCGYTVRGWELGWKSAAQNLADVAAMGALPTGLVISLTLPPETPVDWVTDMARGYCAAIRTLGAAHCTVGGGDVGSGTELSATVAAFGTVPEGGPLDASHGSARGPASGPVLRSGARPGDVLVLAGTVGRAAAGLEILMDRQGAFPMPVPEHAETGPAWAAPEDDPSALAASQLRPLPPLHLGPDLAAAGATAMIDVSDGLLKDAERVARASGVAIDVDSSLLTPLVEPLRRAATFVDEDPLEWVLHGGEDHGILAALPSTADLPAGAIAIGSCGESTDRAPQISVDGRPRDQRGWDHFAAKDRV
ncbi:thiamine-phosphate kinase [Rothia koreensis]|uniref:thiamine-phosphate kinase n=1 Tax=Rothia koreensis TaxID=592378 RepID=UPI003FCD5129